MSDQFIKRIKSLLWRAGAMGVAAICAYIGQNLGILELNATTTAIMGLILGEISKWLNSPATIETLKA